MPRSRPNRVLQARLELAIKLMSPMLDLLLAAGDRTSRLLGSAERDPRAARLAPHGERAPRGLPPVGPRPDRR